MPTNEEYRLQKIVPDAIIGIYEQERTTPQPLLFKLEAKLIDPPYALTHLINESIENYCRTARPLLLERMAYELGGALMQKLDGCRELVLVIEKPNALTEAKCSYVRAVFTA